MEGREAGTLYSSPQDFQVLVSGWQQISAYFEGIDACMHAWMDAWNVELFT